MGRRTSTATAVSRSRRIGIGAEVLPGGVDFRVWAPSRSRVEVAIEGQRVELTPEPGGYFSGVVSSASAGNRYVYHLDGGEARPDPASRWQPEGPHGPSMVIDPAAFEWTDTGWNGLDRSSLVIYELHIGTFTSAGTWEAAAAELPGLADLGITCLEVMPVADFPGTFGWGYDGVNLFAPSRLYGHPDDFRAFVNAAHLLGLGVILDVVYNHFGPDGCYLRDFSPAYFGGSASEWGESFNYDGPDCEQVREFVVSNARYWVAEFHLDGLRIDAAQAVHDSSEPHVLAEVAGAVRQAADGRSTWVVAEDEPQRRHVIATAAEGGFDLDAVWNDDFHHSAVVAATGRREGYYADYAGTPQELVSTAKHGFLYQGQWNKRQGKTRGTPTIGMRPDAFVCFLQNHDQVANWSRGQRLHHATSLATVRTLTALLLLGPWTPMLFQGQEFASDAPFHYFADLPSSLAEAVRSGRRDFLAQFHSATDLNRTGLPEDPADRETFQHSIIGKPSTPMQEAMLALHTSLLQLRNSDTAFRAQHRLGLDGAVLSDRAFVLRFFTAPSGGCADRLLLINLGAQLDLGVQSEPLLAPPALCEWEVLWSSDDPLYGGPGLTPVIQRSGWCLQAESATVLAAGPRHS